MKNTKYALALLLFLNVTPLIPMELQKEKEDLKQVYAEIKPQLTAIDSQVMEEANAIDIDKCVENIDTWINEEYTAYTYTPTMALDFLLSGKDIVDILNTIDKQIPGIPNIEELFGQLYAKNSFLESLIDRLVTNTVKTIENVTADTIDNIRLPKEIHPYEALKHIPFWMKTYIMLKAFDTFNTDKKLTEYTYILQGHTDKINFVRLAADIKQIASCSQDATVRLWSITTGNCDHILKHSACVKSCDYNENGSELATAQQNSDTVLVWNTANGNRTNAIQFPVPIHHIHWREKFLLAGDNSLYCYLKNMTKPNKKILKFFMQNNNTGLSSVNSCAGLFCVSCTENSVILKINNRALHLAEKILKKSVTDYNQLKTLQSSETIAELSELEGKQIKLNLQTKLDQLALKNEKLKNL